MMLVRALTLGWQLDVVQPVSNPLQNLNKIYDFSAMVPLQLQNSLGIINKVKKVIVGGGVVSASLQKEIQDKETKIFATYGMTETITHIAVKKLNHFITNPEQNENKVNEESVYKVLPNVIVSIDERNCLLIQAPNLSKHPIKTNDVVDLITNTEFRWLGRFDNVVNSGGIKLHPERIEEKLASLIQQRFFVAGIKDERLGERLILVVEGGAKEYDFSLINYLNKYEIPRDVYFIDKFIETNTEKIQRFKTLEKLKLC